MKYEYKVFTSWEWCKPWGEQKRYWWLQYWSLPQQMGFRVLGFYVNLMWRLKIRAK